MDTTDTYGKYPETHDKFCNQGKLFKDEGGHRDMCTICGVRIPPENTTAHIVAHKLSHSKIIRHLPSVLMDSREGIYLVQTCAREDSSCPVMKNTSRGKYVSECELETVPTQNR